MALSSPALGWPATIAIAIGGLALYTYIINLNPRVDRLLKRLSTERAGEDRYSFATALGSEQPQAGVIEAVWEALGPYTSHGGRQVPLRPSDSLDWFDIDQGIMEDLPSDLIDTTGRTLQSQEENPFYARRYETIGDLVLFVSHQPLRPPNEEL